MKTLVRIFGSTFWIKILAIRAICKSKHFVLVSLSTGNFINLVANEHFEEKREVEFDISYCGLTEYHSKRICQLLNESVDPNELPLLKAEIMAEIDGLKRP